jgi:hypothetical protein
MFVAIKASINIGQEVTDAKLLLCIQYNLSKFEATWLRANLKDALDFTVTELNPLLGWLDLSVAKLLMRSKR